MQHEKMKTRFFLSVAAMSAGAVLLIYGLFFSNIPVAKGPVSDKPPAITDKADKPIDTLKLPETDIVKDVTRAGVVRRENGVLQRTYGQNVKPADFCPT